MAVTIQINGTTLNPQPKDTSWESEIVGGKLDGTNAKGAYLIHTLKAPPFRGGTANFNWDSFDDTVLTSIQTHPPGQTMKTGTATTYNSGVVARSLKFRAEPGDIISGVELEIAIVV